MESSVDHSDMDTVNAFTCPSSSHFVYDLRNASYEYISSTFFYSDAEQYFILTFFPLLLTLGLVGNVSFFVVVARVPGMRTITNAYLINLAVCDILFILFSINDVLVSFLTSPTVRSKRYASNADCSIAHGCIFAIHFAADCILVFMSFERYLAICKPLKHRIMSGTGRTLKLIILSWICGIVYSALLVAPRFTSYQNICVFWPAGEQYEHLPRFIESCESGHPIYDWFSSMAMSVPYFAAFVLNFILYCLIIRTMHRRVRQVADIGLGIASASEQGAAAAPRPEPVHLRNKVAILLITTGTTYFVCFLPYIILRLDWSFTLITNYKVGFFLSEKQFYTLFWFTVGLATLNSVVNPVIYSVTNKRYRNAFKQVFSCKIQSE